MPLPSSFFPSQGISGELDSGQLAMSDNSRELSYLRPLSIDPGLYNADIWPVMRSASNWTLTQIGGGTGTVTSVLGGWSA